MAFVNVGAYVDGRRPASKAALKRAIAENPETVTFDSTAWSGPRAGDRITCEIENIGPDKLSVCGPDPYSARNWYATVEVRAGTIKIS